MKKSILGTTLMILILLAANAALADDFKGFYVGGFVGGISSRSTAHTTTVDTGSYFASSSVTAINAAGTQSLNSNAFNGGGEAGYNFQSGDFVFGVEGEFGTMHIDKRVNTSMPYPCCAGTGFTISQSIYTDFLSTVRARVGYVHGRAMYYVTGGFATTNLNPYVGFFTDSFAGASETGAVNQWMKGWTVGGGVELRANKHWSVKGEYLYADFGDAGVTSTNLTAGGFFYPDTPFTHTTNLRAHIYRAGFNYRFK